MAVEKIENWEYVGHPEEDSVRVECEKIVAELKGVAGALDDVFKDTRPSHLKMFSRVVPDGKPYMAGNYRGAPFPQLEMRPVFVGGFRCADPHLVEGLMNDFHAQLQPSMVKLGQIAQGWSAKQKIIAFCRLVAIFFARFLSIHPYANGNGHISRLLLWCIFAAHSVNAAFWQIPNRNLNPPDVLIAEFRRGNPQPLVDAFVTLIEAENSTVAI